MKKITQIYGAWIKQTELPQRADPETYEPIYFSEADKEYLAAHILEIQKHFNIRAWRVIGIEIE